MKHAENEVTKVVRVVIGDWRHRSAHDLQDERRKCLRFERAVESGEFEDDATERPNIALLVVRFAFTQLW